MDQFLKMLVQSVAMTQGQAEPPAHERSIKLLTPHKQFQLTQGADSSAPPMGPSTAPSPGSDQGALVPLQPGAIAAAGAGAGMRAYE